jgi:hypothetical protein
MLRDARARIRFATAAIGCVAIVSALAVAIPAGAATTTLLGPVLTKDENPVQTTNRDIGISVALPDGNALWVFGDTPTLEYAAGAWKTTHFVAGSSAAIGPYTPGHVPAPMTQLIVGNPLKPDNQASRFVPAPANVRMPDGTGRVCNQANGATEPGGRWVTGAALLPDNVNVLITYIGVCVATLSHLSVQGFGFMEYDWVHNTISVPPVDVFPPAVNGATLTGVNRLGSPVVSGSNVTLFSETCCSPGDFHAVTIHADVASLSNPASYATHTIPTLHSAVNGLTDMTVGVYPDGQYRLVTMTDQAGGYAAWSAPAADGPWTQTATGTLPGCAAAPDPCYSLIGHPELSTASALFVSYYRPGYGPGVPGHPYPHAPVNHVVMASIAIGAGPAPDPAPVPTGQAAGKATGVKAALRPTSQATGSLFVSFSPAPNNGSVIIKYTAACKSSDGGVTKSAAHAGANPVPITVAGLTTKKKYACTVTATNGWGSGGPSIASPALIVGAPNAPTGVHATKAAAGKLQVTFTPGANNGAAITKYTASCASSDGGVAKSASATVRSIPVGGLTAGKTYTCRVSATNGRGAGPQSLASSAVKA